MTAQQLREPTADGVYQAMGRIAAILPPTPLVPLTVDGAQLWLKDETAQPIRAFKIRGAWNRISAIPTTRRKYGVVALSSGNHALGVAWSARRLDMAATVLMPGDTPAAKLDAVAELGAQIIRYDRLNDDREAMATTLCRDGAALVHPFDDPLVIEGQGTLALEATTQLGRAPDRVIAPCGGGGLLSGSALACPEAELVAVEPDGWDDAGRSIAAGQIVPVGPAPPPTICDGIQTPVIAPLTFDILRRRNAMTTTVSDGEVRAAQDILRRHAGINAEPSGAAGLAAVMAGKVPIDGLNLIVLTGGNGA